jgi:hypothetical protein
MEAHALLKEVDCAQLMPLCLETDSVLVSKLGHIHGLGPHFKAGTQVGQRQTEGVGDLLGIAGTALHLGDLSSE